MSEVAAIVDHISRSLPQVKSGSLAVFGDVFGGRIDNVHTVRAAHRGSTPHRLVIEFEGEETLDVWDPEEWSIGTDLFRIRRASKVRWEWFYYGRPQVPENRYFQEHSIEGGALTVCTDVDWHRPSFDPDLSRPAVELLGM